MMTNSRESSVLFSLKELMALEDQRVVEEATARAAAHAEELERREAATRAARVAEESRHREAEERRRAEEFRAREEATRLQALRDAEIERAVREQAHAARMRELALSQEHERNLAQVAGDQSAKRLKWAAFGSAAALLLVLAGGSLAFRRYVLQSDADRVALSNQVLDAQHEKERTQGALRDAYQRQREEEERRRTAPPPIPTPEPKATAAPRQPNRPPPPSTVTPKPKDKTCHEGDPMCADL